MKIGGTKKKQGNPPPYDFKTTKRVRPKKKSGVKNIAQRRKK